MTGELGKYNQKRDFDKTGEPEGKTEKPGERLRFVIQHHAARSDHFDLRLEWGGVMLSWAIPKGPSYNPRDKRLAVKVEDHPLEYRNFEGTIPKEEYGGGVVMIWDEGYWEPRVNMDEGLKAGSLKFILKGKRLKGKWALIRMKAKAAEPEKNWLFIKEKDEYVLNYDGVSGFTTSIRTGRTMAEILQGRDGEEKDIKNPFDNMNVQLAKLVNKVPAGADWLYELKYDGYRILAYLEGGKARLVSRNGQDYTKRFQVIADSLTEWAGGRVMVLDGEVAVQDAEGRTDFQALQKYIKNPGGENIIYMVFDLLAFAGADLRSRRLIDRKEKLETLMQDSPGSLRYSSHINGNGEDILLAACRANMEGIIGKKADSVYSGTRNGDWVKLKCGNRQEFVIGGYTLSSKKKNGVSALLLGVYDGDELVYAGRAGTGLTSRTMKELEEKFKSIRSNTPPFHHVPKPRKDEETTWLEPVMVAEIRFAEWTEDNLLRQASFKGLRTDKDSRDVKRENEEAEDEDKRAERSDVLSQPQEDLEKKKQMKTNRNSAVVNGVNISNPDKVMFEDAGITKEDVARYYAKTAERMLPYVGNRILSIFRCPPGISGGCFFQKHPDPGAKGIIHIPVKGKSGSTEDYFYIEDSYGLISEAQMGTIEFHTWGSRVDQLELPDMMVFDLDPGEGLDLEKVREGVRDLKGILDELSLVTYLKTSGGKGYHVVIPLKPSVGWDAFSGFARRIAEVMEQRWPDRYTSNMRKEKRKGKIFIDWIRNSRSATSVAPYSLRARKGAPVSMPISWAELDTIAPNGIRMEDAINRMNKEDPWKDFHHTNQRLKGV
ncbi:MAG: DNA ligase D [Christensenellales bacterium]